MCVCVCVFSGVPAVVDLAAMRDAMKDLGGDPSAVNPLVPVDLVIDHSVQVDFSRSPDALEKNQKIEFQRNAERFAFLKWGATAFDNMLIVPPGSGIVHQVNLEYLARVVFDSNNVLYPGQYVSMCVCVLGRGGGSVCLLIHPIECVCVCVCVQTRWLALIRTRP